MVGGGGHGDGRFLDKEMGTGARKLGMIVLDVVKRILVDAAFAKSSPIDITQRTKQSKSSRVSVGIDHSQAKALSC